MTSISTTLRASAPALRRMIPTPTPVDQAAGLKSGLCPVEKELRCNCSAILLSIRDFLDLVIVGKALFLTELTAQGVAENLLLRAGNQLADAALIDLWMVSSSAVRAAEAVSLMV